MLKKLFFRQVSVIISTLQKLSQKNNTEVELYLLKTCAQALEKITRNRKITGKKSHLKRYTLI